MCTYVALLFLLFAFDVVDLLNWRWAYEIFCHFCLCQILRLDSVYYFHDLINQMKSWGYKEGKTLFGFGYDFRQSNRYEANTKIATLILWVYAVEIFHNWHSS